MEVSYFAMKALRLTLISSLFVAVIAVFLNVFPHWYALSHTPTGFVFTGQATWFDPWDVSVYVAAIKWGQSHGFLMENMYTTTPNPAIVYYPFYTLTGLLFPQQNVFVLFYAFSALTTWLLALVTAKIVSKFFQGFVVVTIITLAIFLSGGLGILLFPQTPSLDTFMTSITFQSAFQRPHEAIAMSAFIVALFGFYFGSIQQQQSWRRITLPALCIALVLYPYNILSYFLIVVSFSWWQFGTQAVRSVGKHIIILAIASASIVGLMAYNLSQNSTFAGVVSQKLEGPTFWPFLWTYGLVLVPFLYQLFMWRPLTPLRKFVSVWVIACVILSLLPIGISRFYLRGMFLPLILQAAFVIQALSKKYLEAQFKHAFITGLLYFTAAVSITAIGICYVRVTEVHKLNTWYYFTVAEANALAFLNTNTHPDEGILTLYFMGNRIPTHTHLRAYFGHLLQTPNEEAKELSLKDFYSGRMSEQAALEFLKEARVQYVYQGIEEWSYYPAQFNYPFLKPVFTEADVTIYAVKLPSDK